MYVDPYEEEDICNGMLRVLQDPAVSAELIQRGFENARRFSWEDSARRLHQIIEEDVT